MEIVSEEEEPPDTTPFFRASNIEKSLKLKKLYIKFEGASITGTQKDRISRLHARRAKALGYDTLSLASCGNYGASVSYYARVQGLESVVAVPNGYSGERNAEIEQYGGTLLLEDGKYENLVDMMRDLGNDNCWYDCNPGSQNSFIDFLGYENIAFEIISQLGHAPNFVAVPVGNGTTMTGIYSGFKKAYRMGQIDHIPRLIASSTDGGNAIVYSWKMKSRKIVDLDPLRLKESRANEPLVSYHSIDGQKALNAIYESRGFAGYVSDEEMIRTSSFIERLEKVQALPASSSALSVAVRVMRKFVDYPECVVVLTGRGKPWTTQ